MVLPERGFLRALKETRQHERTVEAAEALGEELGSCLPGEMTDEEFDAMYDEAALPGSREPFGRVESAGFSTTVGRIDVPISINKRR